MTFLETAMGLCLLISLLALGVALNRTLVRGLEVQEHKLTQITKQYLNQWNAKL